jgi:hypothetical protein
MWTDKDARCNSSSFSVADPPAALRSIVNGTSSATSLSPRLDNPTRT